MNEGGPDAANPETRDRRIYRRVLAVLIFHQSVWYLLYQIGMIPPKRPAWPLDPIPPCGVPSVISKAF
ncbi:MAG: hypothetical protein WB713_17210 [Methyloceanibacter sp.]